MPAGRNRGAAAVAALVATLVLLTAPASAQDGPAESRITAVTFQSPALGVERRLQVYTPAGYGERGNRRYPTLYLAGGGGEDETGWLEKGNAKEILDTAIASGAATPMVVVFIESRRYYDNVNEPVVEDRFPHDLAGTIIPLVEDQFNVVRRPRARAVAGLSLGGVETVDTVVRRPGLARYYAAWSVAGWFPRPREDLVANHSDLLDGERINPNVTYFEIRTGIDDPFTPLARATHELLEGSGVAHSYDEVPGTHEWPVWQRLLREAAPKLFARPIRGLAGKCVDVASASDADGTPVQLFECNRTAAQRWTIPGDGTVRALGKCLDVTGGATANGAPVGLFTCNGTAAQEWRSRPSGILFNLNSGRCLDAADRSSDNGARLQLWDCHGGANQRWSASASEAPIRGLAGKCVDVAGADATNGTPVQLYDCNGTMAQRWRVSDDGSVQALGKCLDVPGGARDNGTAVQLYDCNGSGAQEWRARPDGTLVNARSNRCLDVTAERTGNGTPLQVWDCHGRANQRWSVRPGFAAAGP